MRINYNISSIIARNALNNNDNRLSNSIQRLSSGLKINSAADDAAGLAIAIKMNAQIKSLEQANKNANDGVSVVNTADGAMAEMHDILQRMNELAIQSANGTNADSDREQLQLEIDQLVQELDRIAETTQFNAQNLLDGSFAYKGYTNTENIKVKSYGDGVISGTYVIGKIEYDHYEDKVMDYAAYIDGTADGKISEDDYFMAVKADDIKDALVTEEAEGIRTFPESSRVILDDENIIIEAENDFDVVLTVNDRMAVQNSGVTTTSVSKYYYTDNYQNITVIDETGTAKYNITELNFIREYNITTTTTGTSQVNIINTTINTGSEQEGLRHLEEDLEEAFKAKFPDAADFSVASCTYSTTASTKTYVEDGMAKNYTINEGTFEIGVIVMDKSGNTTTETMTFKVHIPLPDSAGLNEAEYNAAYGKYEAGLNSKIHEDNLNKYLYTRTETKKTTYTVGDGTEANSLKLNLTGMGPMRLQVGANEGQVIQVEIPALTAWDLGVDDTDITTEGKATAAIDVIGKAINELSGIRAKIGAYANRIEHTITNLNTTTENMTASYSRIMDVDMATEMTEYSTVQVLVESSTAMLAQANERPQSVLQLLQ